MGNKIDTFHLLNRSQIRERFLIDLKEENYGAYIAD